MINTEFGLVYQTLVLLCAVERIVEMALSRSHQRALRAKGFKLIEQKRHLNGMVLMHMLWFVALVVEPYLITVRWPTEISYIFLLLFLLAQSLRLWVLRTLGVHWNISVMGGEGVTDFVSTGPYRYIRHPNYLAVVLEFVSLPLIVGAWITALSFSIANVLILKKRIALEDAQLENRPGYLEFMAHKPRLLWRLW